MPPGLCHLITVNAFNVHGIGLFIILRELLCGREG
jgi:hypothetical protein